ncbi:MAG: NgoFVII family restriction endonuclease [Ardenticatenales bacterium]|nr:NgoFVII family restriction endonuclease [Ardenticatenales bacterium]
MPKIFDNIERKLLPALQQTLEVSFRADFSVGYFNLRGWREIDKKVEEWTGGEGAQCRLLVGMHRRPQDELRAAFSFNQDGERIDNKTAVRLRQELAQEFREQLMVGAPTNADEAGLRRLAQQIREGKLCVKLFLRHPLHAKLYLLFRHDSITPIIGYTGSSNLTFSGLSGQGELNLDVVEQDAANKLADWFEQRWNDRWCVDISDELVEIIEESWAGERLIPPYHIYLKMAYHLSREARAGLSEFTIPREFSDKLFDFQTAAVKIAARHLNQRGGVLIGDVVGLGKTIMATAVAKIFEEDYLMDTLILCPKNLVKMWEWYAAEYRLHAKVLPITRVQQELPDLRRYRLVLIDESHNLRNREGKRYRAIQEYIQKNDSRCILLSATPYNKTYLDLSSQLRLFVPETADLGIRPEHLLREITEVEFVRRYQASLRSLEAFEKSDHPDDWRELMSLFMVRRTRSFIRDNYALTDPKNGRKYLSFADGSRAYFPTRHPKRATFLIDEDAHADQYARMYGDSVVNAINGLNLPRYGLGNYVRKKPSRPPTHREAKIIDDLSRGGRRLMGFSRTNLFKRLESSGYAFLLSVERHILRNYIFIHALDNNQDLPIGTQGAEMLDTRFEDEDAEAIDYATDELFDDDTGDLEGATVVLDMAPLRGEAAFLERAATIYGEYFGRYRSRFKWIRADLFDKKLRQHLLADARALLSILQRFSDWSVNEDAKLNALQELLTQTHPKEKVLVFSQFADTVDYVEQQLRLRGVQRVVGVTGDSDDPTTLAWRFSPESNGKREAIDPDDELRVLIATDVLSEGQNLQDCHVVVNYDLPWAIIRLIQRAGRVDRIGQKAADILSYTFWPTEGVERIIRLRERLRQRLQENAEVVGTDEAFFEEDGSNQPLFDLYHEKAGVLDEEAGGEVEIDLVSYAFQIWKNATDANPTLRNVIPKLPQVVYSSKAYDDAEVAGPPGVLVYMNTSRGNHALAWIDPEGNSVTESQFTILKAAACALNTPALPRQESHHELVQRAVQHVMTERTVIGGQLGRPSGARFKTYERLKAYAERLQKTLFAHEAETLVKALDEIFRFPLQEAAKNTLNRQLRSNITDEALSTLAVTLYEEGRLCLVQDEDEVDDEPEIICSLGLAPTG